MPQEESGEIAHHADNIANERQTRRLGNLSARRREQGYGLKLAERLSNRLADQVHLPNQFDPLPHLVQFFIRQNVAENTAGIGQSDNDDIARTRDFFAEQHAHNA